MEGGGFLVALGVVAAAVIAVVVTVRGLAEGDRDLALGGLIALAVLSPIVAVIAWVVWLIASGR